MVGAWHGKCESDTGALCKSNWKDTFYTLCGTAWQGNGMVGAWHGHGMASVNQIRPHYVNKMRKTHSKPLAARHGRGTEWSEHGMGMGWQV